MRSASWLSLTFGSWFQYCLAVMRSSSMRNAFCWPSASALSRACTALCALASPGTSATVNSVCLSLCAKAENGGRNARSTSSKPRFSVIANRLGSSMFRAGPAAARPARSYPTSREDAITSPNDRDHYREAGVDIDAGDALVDALKPLARSTARAGSDAGLGGFGALFDLKAAGFRDPILVATTDGVGTKLKIAIAANRHQTVGIDLVAMCVNDLVVQGAEPLFFLDYF